MAGIWRKVGTRKHIRTIAPLCQARKDAGLTQVQVAKAFGTHASFVSKCESGERRIDVVELADFCRLYNVKPSVILKAAGLE